jgi:hypothetical protein
MGRWITVVFLGQVACAKLLYGPPSFDSQEGASVRASSGAYITFSSTTEALQPSNISLIRGSSAVTGVQVAVSWNEIEPASGTFSFSAIDNVLNAYVGGTSRTAKRVGLRLATSCGGYDGTADSTNRIYVNSAMPTWIWSDPKVKRLGGYSVTGVGTLALYPVYWDVTYQSYFERLIAALSSRYDNDERLAFIRWTAHSDCSNEPNFYSEATPLLRAGLEANGAHFDGNGQIIQGAEEPYTAAVVALIDLTNRYFKSTRLMVTFHLDHGDEKSFEFAMNQRACAFGNALVNTGLNESEKSATREEFASYFHLGCPVGWGGITKLGTKVPPNEIPAHGYQWEAVYQGLGLPAGVLADGRDYSPESHSSYIMAGTDAVTEWPDAFSWALNHLEER